jgi:3-methyladenine DNA glycosylase AlkD
LDVPIDIVMEELAALGSPRVADVYRRRGAGDRQFGVRLADLRTVARRIGHDQDVAEALWASGNTDARMLACMVAEPARMDDADLDRWLSDITYHVLVDEFVASLAVRVHGVVERMERWRTSRSDWTGQAGYDLLAHLAMKDPSLPDSFFLDHLAIIEREIHGRGNRTRHAMNGALIAIGIRNERLADAATSAAERIGVVIVDHGETGCVTPDAIPYIERARARARARQAGQTGQAGSTTR